MKKVFLITKLKTTNIGNESLSNEIIHLFSEFAKDIVLNINGRPFGLDGYYPNRIITTSNPIEVLDKWADSIVKKIRKEKSLPFKSNSPQVKLLSNDSDFRNEILKARLRPLKRLLVSFVPYSKEYSQRAATLKSADWLVYSGAGEVGDNIVFLRQLVEIRVAQKLGIKTAAVNQSVIIKTEPFKKLIGYVYGKMAKIVVRGENSKKNLLSYGVSANLIEIAPDTAINSNFTGSGMSSKNDNLVAFNITPRTNINQEEIGIIINQLHSLGKKIIFITNEPFDDRKIGHMFSKKFNIEFVSKFASYHAYMTKLAQCDFVISARLHTNILSLVTHTPIISIEGNIFKSTELLNELQYPVATLNSSEPGWINTLLKEINNLINDHYDLDTYFKDTFPVQRKRAQRNAAWINEYE